MNCARLKLVLGLGVRLCCSRLWTGPVLNGVACLVMMCTIGLRGSCWLLVAVGLVGLVSGPRRRWLVWSLAVCIFSSVLQLQKAAQK